MSLKQYLKDWHNKILDSIESEEKQLYNGSAREILITSIQKSLVTSWKMIPINDETYLTSGMQYLTPDGDLLSASSERVLIKESYRLKCVYKSHHEDLYKQKTREETR